MGRQLFADAFLEAQNGDVATVTTFTSATNLWDSSLWTSVPAFDTRSGKIWVLRAGGVMGAVSTNTLIVQARWGISQTPASNVTFGASRTFAMPALTAVPWILEAIIVCRSIGTAAATATMTCNGQLTIQGAAAAVDIDLSFGGTTITTGTWNVATGVSVDATMSGASATNTFTTKWCYIQNVN